MRWTRATAHSLWAHQLREMAEEKRELGDESAARELERQAQVQQRRAERARPSRGATIVREVVQ